LRERRPGKREVPSPATTQLEIKAITSISYLTFSDKRPGSELTFDIGAQSVANGWSAYCRFEASGCTQVLSENPIALAA
jgi:hypothetical protein